jgi:hypothetical protein
VTLLTFLVGTPSGKDLVGVDAELMLEIAYILGDATCCQAVRCAPFFLSFVHFLTCKPSRVCFHCVFPFFPRFFFEDNSYFFQQIISSPFRPFPSCLVLSFTGGGVVVMVVVWW